jgi:phosphoribosylformylglycinamidine synthase
MSRPRVAVIQFPGSNCEYETARAARLSGLEADVVRWNTGSSLCSGYDACILPGGFSFQDRIRAGAVAAKEPVMDAVSDMAGRGIPILGICNGAQILVESGLVPGWAAGRVEACLAANHVSGRSGYYTSWIFVRAGAGAERSPWLCRAAEQPIPLPVAHAEGRFVFSAGVSRESLDRGGNTGLVYCRPDGSEALGFPWNPNGASFDLAGVLNGAGNVLALMPHPERARMLWQVPPALAGEWGTRRRSMAADDTAGSPGPGAVFFDGLASALGRAGL